MAVPFVEAILDRAKSRICSGRTHKPQ
jgi:hypothetical protein